MMKVLVLGSGGREHSIIRTLQKTSSAALKLYCAPGNAGISQSAQCVPISPVDHSALIQFAQAESIGLTVVGPEVPLANGIVDQFESKGLSVFGPSRAAARLESSKSFAKDFMVRNKIPTAGYRVAGSPAEAFRCLQSGEFGSPDSPVVIKADGLAAGKGVIVANSRAHAEKAIERLMTGDLVGPEAAKQVVIEEALQGTEASVLVFSDGRDYALMPPARDHKRLGEDDTGPNTGGMGAITDVSILEDHMLERIVREIVEPALEGARAEGFTFRGVLFVGLMLTVDGPKVLEYNVRFGDPETQAILVRLQTDLLQLFETITVGKLGEVTVDWSDESSACVVLASRGYPGKYEIGIPIAGLDRCSSRDNVEVFHAGTVKAESGEFLTAGGRVLGVTATGGTLGRALAQCYGAIERISWAGMQYRRDIGRFKEASTQASS